MSENACRVCFSLNIGIGTVSRWNGVLTRSTPTEAAIASDFIDFGVVELEVASVKRIFSRPIAMLHAVSGCALGSRIIFPLGG